MTIKFAHIRNKTSWKEENPKISNLGGTTIAYEVLDHVECVDKDPTKEYLVAYARCSPKDNFCKKTGRAIASGRLKSPKQSFVYRASSIKELIAKVMADINY